MTHTHIDVSEHGGLKWAQINRQTRGIRCSNKLVLLWVKTVKPRAIFLKLATVWGPKL